MSSPSLVETPIAAQSEPSAASRTSHQAQMNVRMDSALKASGDAALAQAGYTPSAAVRALWAFAATHATAPQEITALLDSAESAAKDEADDRAAHRLALVEGGPHAIASFMQRFSAGAPVASNGHEADDDLLFEALTERMRERGTL